MTPKDIAKIAYFALSALLVCGEPNNSAWIYYIFVLLNFAFACRLLISIKHINDEDSED